MELFNPFGSTTNGEEAGDLVTLRAMGAARVHLWSKRDNFFVYFPLVDVEASCRRVLAAITEMAMRRVLSIGTFGAEKSLEMLNIPACVEYSDGLRCVRRRPSQPALP